MGFFVPFVIAGVVAAKSHSDNKRARREAEEAERRRNEALRLEEARRIEAERQRLEAERADQERRFALEREQAEREAAQRAEAAREESLCRAREEERMRKEAEDSLLKGIPPVDRPQPADIQRIRARYNYQPDKFNIAIVGESGMGKSTLLNAVRGLLSGDSGAAVTGFNESTTLVRGYPDPRNASIVWYDVPGADTPSINGWGYFTHQGLYIFDALIIVFCDRFTQTAATLISNAEACGVPAFLVRTKADQIIRDIQADSDGEIKEEEARYTCIKETDKMVQENLSNIGVSHRRTYIVSRTGMKNYVASGSKNEVISDDLLLGDIVSISSEVLYGRR